MPARRTPIKRESDRHRAQRPTRTAVVARVFARDGWRCQFVAHCALELEPFRHYLLPVLCHGRLDPHEIIPRSAWKLGYLVDMNVVTICRSHHHWIDDHPEQAHRIWLHGYSYERPPT